MRDVFDFVEMDCDLSITALAAAARRHADLAAAPLPAPGRGARRTRVRHRRPASQGDRPGGPGRAGRRCSFGSPSSRPSRSRPPPRLPLPPPPAPVAAAPVTIRVDLDRVDRLINVVGELVIQQAMLAQRVVESGLARSSDIALGLEDLELLTREIQDSVMAIRAQPVKSVFQRMPRLVREVAEMTGKRVRLVTSGEDTEVDKTVVERLAEPITHMLRNAIDHGLEGPEEREAAGKPAEGTSVWPPCTARAASSSRFPTTEKASTAPACAASPSIAA